MRLKSPCNGASGTWQLTQRGCSSTRSICAKACKPALRSGVTDTCVGWKVPAPPAATAAIGSAMALIAMHRRSPLLLVRVREAIRTLLYRRETLLLAPDSGKSLRLPADSASASTVGARYARQASKISAGRVSLQCAPLHPLEFR